MHSDLLPVRTSLSILSSPQLLALVALVVL
jgi:hypothetical protein